MAFSLGKVRDLLAKLFSAKRGRWIVVAGGKVIATAHHLREVEGYITDAVTVLRIPAGEDHHLSLDELMHAIEDLFTTEEGAAERAKIEEDARLAAASARDAAAAAAQAVDALEHVVEPTDPATLLEETRADLAHVEDADGREPRD